MSKNGRLVVAKAGRSPWWPSEVVEDDGAGKVQVSFLGMGQRSWVGEGDVARVRTREQLQLFLEEKRVSNGDNLKYTNNVPETIRESYDNAWNLYIDLFKLESDERSTAHDNDLICGVNTSKEHEVGYANVPCEVCVKKVIERECGLANTKLLSLSEHDRDAELACIMVSATDAVTECDNRCLWKYHSRCVISENDLVCSCNKSSWQCSVCDQMVSVSEMFICEHYECMRAYHKTCISAHLDLQPDIKQCPLHQCINCRLDGLEANDAVLAYCIKCKVSFHNNRQCLPLTYLTVSDKYIICGRHLLDLDTLQSSCVDFCFYCLLSTKDTVSITCSYCPITYHNSPTCLPNWLDLSTDDQHFICHGCKFPLVRRSSYMILSPPSSTKVNDISAWRIGLSEGSRDFKTLVMHDPHNDITYRESLYNIIPINLQSLDHLFSFGLVRFTDMQKSIRHLSSLVSSLSSINTNRANTYRRNGFVLIYSSLFPIVDNVYDSPQFVESRMEGVLKCACNDYCSTIHCYNVAANTECNKWNCNSLSRCRNRRLQKRLFPRQKLVMFGDDQHKPCIVLEEAVVKDVLVMELAGRVIPYPIIDPVKLRQHLFILSDSLVIDNSRYCNLSRFVQHSDWPNLVSKARTVNGSRRLGLFSSRRIAANETLTIDMNVLLLGGNAVLSLNKFSMNVVPWSEFIVQENVDDSCSEYISHATVIDLSLEDNDLGDVGCNDITLCQRPPLCPVCLKELIADYSISRSLIHCVNCYTVHHLKCAYSSLTMTRTHCRVEKDPRMMRFVCVHCRAMMDD